jgi:polyisoprenoid-binding protein YceI
MGSESKEAFNSMRIIHLLPILLLPLAIIQARAAPQRLPLLPTGSAVAIRAYALGFVPLDGRFTRFSGWLTYNPENLTDCRVELTVETASLVMPDASARATLVGTDFLDVVRYPTIEYAGACQARALTGRLDLHGVNGPFVMALDWSPGRVIASGRLRRADWGMTARPLFGGPTIRIEVAVRLQGT